MNSVQSLCDEIDAEIGRNDTDYEHGRAAAARGERALRG